MFLIPLQVDVPMYRRPIANMVIIGIIVCCFFLELSQPVSAWEPYVLDGWAPRGLIGHLFLHGGWMHLIGNLLFLWVFGNAVCEKVGNIAYPFVFLGLGVLAGAAQVLFGGGKAIGASGAINGIVGMFLVWFPLNAISVFYFFWFFLPRWGRFELASYWMILLWLLFDVFGVLLDAPGVAYWAHVGGFAAGVLVAVLLTQSGWVTIYDDSERTLLDILHVRRAGSRRRGEEMLADDEEEPEGWSGVTRSINTARPQIWTLPPPPPEPPPPPPPRRDAAPAGRVRFRCACGALLQATQDMVGQTVRCPACRHSLRVPLTLR